MEQNLLQNPLDLVLEILFKILIIQGAQFIHALLFRVLLIVFIMRQENFFEQNSLNLCIFFIIVWIYNVLLLIRIAVLFIEVFKREFIEIIEGIVDYLRVSQNYNFTAFECNCLDFLLGNKKVDDKLMKLYWVIILLGNFVFIYYLKELNFDINGHKLLLTIIVSYYIYIILFAFLKYSPYWKINIFNLSQHLKDSKKVFDYIDQLEIIKQRYSKDQKVCMICLEDINQLYIILPCNSNHYFHEKCIKPWLKQKITCPICRTNIFKYYNQLRQI